MNPHPPWLAVKVPAEIMGLPGMLAPEECQYYVWLTEHEYRGKGAIVDLGCWLGKSSVHLALGLQRSRRAGRIVAYDRFVWEQSYMSEVHDLRLPDGADFLPDCERLTAPFSQFLELRKQDLSDYRWPGGPIEILVVDAAKNWQLTNAILRGFAHALVPGLSRVVFQDFRFDQCHWLPLIIDSRPDLWQEVEATGTAWTVTMRPRRSLVGEGGLAAEYHEQSFSWQEARRIFQERIAREPKSARHFLRRGLFRRLLLDAPDEVIAQAREDLFVEPEHAPTAEDLLRLQDLNALLLGPGWQALEARDFARANQIAERCLRTARERFEPLELLALSALRGGNPARAAALARELDELDPTDSSGTLIEAEVDLAEGRPEPANERLFAFAEKYDPRPDHWSWFETVRVHATIALGWQALERGDLQSARALAKEATELEPTDSSGTLIEVEVDLAEGQSSAAYDRLRAFIAKHSPRSDQRRWCEVLGARTAIVLAWQALERGELESATALAREAVAFDRKQVAGWHVLVAATVGSKDLDAAEAAVAEGLAAAPDDPLLRLGECDVDRRRGRSNDLSARVLAILSAPQHAPDVMVLGLRILTDLGNSADHAEEVERTLTRLSNLWPDDASVRALLFSSRLQRGDPQGPRPSTV